MELILTAIVCFTVPFLYLIVILRCKNSKVNNKFIQKYKSDNWNNVSPEKEKSLDYGTYKLNFRERILYTLMAAGVIFAVSYLFFNNAFISLCFCPVSLLYQRIKRIELIRKRKKELNLQFKEALHALSSSLSAGRTIELAFKSAVQDLSLLYPDTETYIIREMELINRKIEMNETIESALEDLAKRASLEDISNFVDIFLISKRSGANLIEVIKNTANIINDKIEIQQEIETLLSQRKFEQKILNAIPIGIMVFLYLTSPDYVAPIYTTLQGRVTMLFVLLMLAAAFFISQKIVEIKV